MIRNLLLCFFFFCFAEANAQEIDSIPLANGQVVQEQIVPTQKPLRPLSDSMVMRPGVNEGWTIDPEIPLTYQVLKKHPYFGFNSVPVVINAGLKKFEGKELLFYVIIGYLLVFALLKEAFPKYLSDLFRLFFRTTMKQRQIRDQLVQTPLPSLLFNGFFAVSAGLYINILLHYYDVSPLDNFWLMFFYCCLGLITIYLVKFLGLKVTGWLLNVSEAANAYIFVVFIINKVIGIFLLPFLVVLSFTQGTSFKVFLVISWCGLGLLIIYRFLLTFISIRNLVRFNLFHFLIYLLAFEIAPLLLVYKLLLFFFR